MGIARGWLFEAYAHNRFFSSSDIAGGTTAYTLDPAPDDTSGEYQPQSQLRNPRPAIPSDGSRLCVPDDFRDNPAATEYHIPSAKSNPGFDSFLITETAVFIFQMTVSRAHTADTRAQKGLLLLKQILSTVPWHVLFAMNILLLALTLDEDC